MDAYELASMNGKDITSLILPGQTLTVNGSAAPDSQAAAPADTTQATTETNDANANTYPVGQCTWGLKLLQLGQATGGAMAVIGPLVLLHKVTLSVTPGSRVYYVLDRWWLWTCCLCYSCW